MKDPRREHRLIPILQFVHTQVYKYAFGRPADGLERSVEGEDECEFAKRNTCINIHTDHRHDHNEPTTTYSAHFCA